MFKDEIKNYPVIAIHISPSEKEALKTEAKKKGLQLTPYCRMILIESLRNNDNANK